MAKLVESPRPAYPPMAQAARVQGTVTLEATIAADGTVRRIDLLKGHPFLGPAAMDAVKNWRYKPTLLNNQPVEVLTTIDVHFTLE